jgi:hypothetical protein
VLIAFAPVNEHVQAAQPTTPDLVVTAPHKPMTIAPALYMAAGFLHENASFLRVNRDLA